VPDLPIGYTGLSLGPQDPRGPLQQTVVRIESMAGIWSFRLNFVKNLCLNYYSRNLVLFNFGGDNARVFQQVSMNLSMTVGQATCRLLCRYIRSTLAASCVCWIVPIVTFDSVKRTCRCLCLKCTWSVASLTGGRGANRSAPCQTKCKNCMGPYLACIWYLLFFWFQ